MALANTLNSYGSISRTLHWLTAGLILVLLPLGLVAHQWPYETPQQLAVKADLFVVHKTLGVTAFFVAFTRILWAITQSKPKKINGDKPLEAWLAETIHWVLYGSILLVPLTGWIGFAGFAGFHCCFPALASCSAAYIGPVGF